MAQPTKPRIDTATVSSVNDSASVQTLTAANSNRTFLSIYNDSSAILYVKLGSNATTSDYSRQIASQGYWELPTTNCVYTGIVTGIWASDSSGAAKITVF